MEKKEYKVSLEERSERSVLVFNINSKEYVIDLNSEEQTSLRILFFEIIKLTFTENPEFKLDDPEPTFNKQLFIDISKEYIRQLNTDIQKIINEKPSLT